MEVPDWGGPRTEAYDRATGYLAGLPNRPVGPRATADELRSALGGSLPEVPTDAQVVVSELAAAVEDGLLAHRRMRRTRS